MTFLSNKIKYTLMLQLTDNDTGYKITVLSEICYHNEISKDHQRYIILWFVGTCIILLC